MGKESPKVKFTIPQGYAQCYYCGLDVIEGLIMVMDTRNQCIAPVHVICFNEHKEEME